MSEFPQVDVKSLKVAELKEELTKRGLETKGLKKDVSLSPSMSVKAREARELTWDSTHVQLADRLQAFQDSQSQKADDANSGDVKAATTETAAKDEEQEEGVGRTMLDGYPGEPSTQHHPSPPGDVTKDEISTEPAALDEEVAKVVAEEEAKAVLSPTPSPPRRLSPIPMQNEETQEVGVGEVMVDGYPEDPSTNHHQIKADRSIEQVEPKVLDNEVAQVVAAQETKEISLEKTSPSPPKRLSPLANQRAEDEDEDMQIDDEEEEEEGGEQSRKRPRSDTPDDKSKRQKIELPSTLSHIREPPTSVLYVNNLKRPLLHSTLHSYLTPSSSSSNAKLPSAKMPFASEEYGGLWLSGVKSHAYATYPSVQDAIEVAEKVENTKWPEDTGDILKIHFIPEDKLLELVEQEEQAWANGRKKLDLNVREDGGWIFELSGAGGLGRIPPPPRELPMRNERIHPARVDGGSGNGPIAVPLTGGRGGSGLGPGPRAPLTGVNAINPTGPVRGQAMGIRGRANNSLPLPHGSRGVGIPPRDNRDRTYDRNGTGEGLRGWTDEKHKEREIMKMRPTRYRPRLFWKKGPGALEGI
ncbi:hypothetical protein L486_05125 [Kwoniella mangroviensis CBS 10435]|uniref:SAP domain-containing protein n=1 Tax=Kwoniella mangroviensis CBS 10435 TaxID=1331196 RepID=A0A1B9IQ16_9TREE|nr:hypothetical protein L486_05125 [Kwoniella mangroviensis CBS 10435]